jgi:hypothetical protein
LIKAQTIIFSLLNPAWGCLLMLLDV